MSSWLHDYYDDIDNGRIEQFTARHTEDLVMQMAGLPPVRGRAEALAAPHQLFTTVRSFRHHFVNVFEDGDTTILEALVTYTRLDDTEVEVPSVTLLHRRGDLVDHARVYIDLAPVFAAG